jgi:hypothetical protein
MGKLDFVESSMFSDFYLLSPFLDNPRKTSKNDET